MHLSKITLTVFITVLHIKCSYSSVVTIPSKLQEALDYMRNNDVTNLLHNFVTVHEKWIKRLEEILELERKTNRQNHHTLENPADVLQYLNQRSLWTSGLVVQSVTQTHQGEANIMHHLESFMEHLIPADDLLDSAKGMTPLRCLSFWRRHLSKRQNTN